jgi:hypothetical protein
MYPVRRQVALPTAAKGAAAIAVKRDEKIDEAIERSPLDAVHRAATAGAYVVGGDMRYTRRDNFGKTRQA